ncbi:Ig-like domain-containing protein [Kitasatospora sp. NPDC051914]|uniref:L,D-transpeptidase n=1 Tax=Kitasatospora sp. NPDC051914 TaxID=3154945 RepID=UPI003419DF5A
MAVKRAAGRVVAAAVLGGALVLTTACSSSGGGSSSTGSGKQEEQKKSQAVVSIEPANGATKVKPSGALKVAVANGKLTAVKVTGKDGKEVPGTLTADGLGWTPSQNLAVSTEYKVSAQAADASGVATTAESTFTTLTPTKGASPYDNIADGQTYGVGMIVSLSFKKAVENKAAVEKAVTFEASDGTVVKPHWFGNNRVDFRPEKFWKPQTKVTVHYKLKSVEVAKDVYGEVDSDQTFTIGRSRVAVADASSKQMVVKEDGKPDATIPISAGATSPASQNTFNGTMVVMAKEGTTVMDSSTVVNHEGPAYKVEMPHALRLTPTGTYVHGKYAPGVFGRTNTSHGCIGLEDTSGKDGSDGSSAGLFYAAAIVGDPVTVQNSVGQQVRPDNGMSGWNISWDKW